jgi:hypothetical protein
VASRAASLVLAATVTVTVPGPVPLAPDAIESQSPWTVAVQEQFAPVFTVTVVLEASGPIAWLAAVS